MKRTRKMMRRQKVCAGHLTLSGAQGMLAGGIEEDSGEAGRHRSDRLSTDAASSVSRVSEM